MGGGLPSFCADVAALAREAQPTDFADGLGSAVHRLVPFDGYCLFGVDPQSGLRTFMYGRDSLDGVAARLAHNETHEPDVNRYADLSVAARPVGVLSRGTADPPASRSPRLHEILRPAGFGSELRLVLRDAKQVWGALVLFRESSGRVFGEREAQAAAGLSVPLAGAVRRHPMRHVSASVDTLPAGLVLLDPQNRVLSMTPAAGAWLDDLRAGGTDQMTQEDITRIVFDAAHAARTQPTESTVHCHTRTTSGRWLELRASRIDVTPADIAVTLHAANTQCLLPTASVRWGLTAREAEVLSKVVEGRGAKQIARMLGISLATVNTHLKTVYRKAGVSGRQELLANLA
jgi:DNA-binding CsgD family transcriptional regulator